MSITSNSTIPELVLELDAIRKTVTYRNVKKNIPETYWTEQIAPTLYPEWDSDKDKLVLFAWYSNSTYLCQRRKYMKNFSSGEYFWKDYEFEMIDPTNEQGLALFDKLKEAFFLVESLETIEYELEFAKIHAQTRTTNWLTVRLSRNFLLDETDHVFIEDSPYSEEDKAMYRLYRQKLRDIPQDINDVDPALVKFPINPTYFKQIFLAKDPDAKYLETEEQFVELAPHYFNTFREKFVSYLIVKNISEGLYASSFIDALKESGVVYDKPAYPMSADQKVIAGNYLKGVLQQLESEMENGSNG
jgi:Phage tail assembly chaperone protein